MKFIRCEGGGWYIRLGRLTMMLGRNGAVSGMPLGFSVVWKAKEQPDYSGLNVGAYNRPIRGFILSGHWQEPMGFAPETVE